MRATGPGPYRNVELESGDWLMVRAAVAEDDSPETLAAMRRLTDCGHLVPIPKPAAAIWRPEDDARVHRTLSRLGVPAEEVAAVIGHHDTSGLPDSDLWRLLQDMSQRLARIQQVLEAPLPPGLEDFAGTGEGG